MVDDQLDRLEGIDLPRIAAQPLHGIAHGGQVDNRRYAGEVLEEHPAGPEGDLAVRLRHGVPRRQPLDVVGRDRDAVFVTQEVFEQDFEGKRQARGVQPGPVEGVEPVVVVCLTVHREGRSSVEGVRHGSSYFSYPCSVIVFIARFQAL